MMLTDLADAVRSSGLPVVEVDGWRTRAATDNAGNRELVAMQTIVAHHTATPLTVPGDYPTLATVRDGRSDLPPGPLAQLGLGRSGTVYVIAAGLCWHAGATFEESQDNWHAIGIEAEHDGISPWPPDLLDAYARLCAALCRHYGLGISRVMGHKEIASPAGRKTDPNFDMTAFRARVLSHLEEIDMTPDELRAILREELLAFGKNGGELIKVDHDGDPDTAKWSLERRLRATDAAVEALGAGISDQVAAGIQAGLADAVIDVNVNIGTKETP